MRVLHLHSGNFYGGVETLMLTMAKWRQLAISIEPEFALCFDGQLAKELNSAGVTIYNLGKVRARNPFSVLRARHHLSDLLTNRAFDVIICHMPWAQAIFGQVVRRHKVNLVFWMHGTASGRHWIERWAAMTCPDLALCNSKFSASTLHNLYPNVRSQVVRYPVDVAVSRLSMSERILVRSELGTDQEAVVIVQTSRMESWKGQLIHLEALSKLRDVPEWVCWQVGGPQRPKERKYFEKLKQRSYELGIAERVKFLGQRSDVMRLLAAADIYCQPNASPEPFGIAFVEALCAGLPIVSSGIGGAVEIIDESCGILVPPTDPKAVATALERLIKNPLERSRLGAAGPARASRLCDPKNQFSKLSRILQDCTRGTTSRVYDNYN